VLLGIRKKAPNTLGDSMRRIPVPHFRNAPLPASTIEALFHFGQQVFRFAEAIGALCDRNGPFGIVS